MAYETLKVETRERVGIIALDRPDAMNAINAQMLGELRDALAKFDADDAVAAVIVTGDDRVFCAGHDIAELRAATSPDLLKADPLAESWLAIWRSRKPLIAAVAGYAQGGGLELALACDFIIAAEKARFGFPDTKFGIIPPVGGAQRLARLIGRAKATEMLLTGRNIDAAEAERAGLVSQVFPADAMMDEAHKAATRIAERAPLAVLAAKEAVRAVDETLLGEGLRSERRLYHALLSAEDAREGMDAYLEQRAPQFRGK